MFKAGSRQVPGYVPSRIRSGFSGYVPVKIKAGSRLCSRQDQVSSRLFSRQDQGRLQVMFQTGSSQLQVMFQAGSRQAPGYVPGRMESGFSGYVPGRMKSDFSGYVPGRIKVGSNLCSKQDQGRFQFMFQAGSRLNPSLFQAG
jgi:hypothetical protein